MAYASEEKENKSNGYFLILKYAKKPKKVSAVNSTKTEPADVVGAHLIFIGIREKISDENREILLSLVNKYETKNTNTIVRDERKEVK